MKILHVCLASPYTEGLLYQDNMLANQNIEDGHDVMVIAKCEYFEDGKPVPISPEDRILSNGIRLVRLAYDSMLGRRSSAIFKKSKKLIVLVREFAPDTILFHGLVSWELLNIAKYKQKHPTVKLFVDSHLRFDIADNRWHVMNIYFRLYRKILRRALPFIDKIFYTTEDAKIFLEDVYRVEEERMEFFPLGGKIIRSQERNALRELKRAEMNLAKNDILLCHTGKFDKLKRTEDVLRAFSKVPDQRLKLVILGKIPPETKQILEPLIRADSRVVFCGWKDGEELKAYLCACDMYVQPGAQSATMENAICCGAPVMLYPHVSYMAHMWGNGFFVKSQSDMVKVFKQILELPEMLEMMRENSLQLANNLLDYRIIASKLY